MTAVSTVADDVVVLVDDHDLDRGTAAKLDVHRDGRLHRAVSVMLHDANGRLLLQRRAAVKYHSGGLWSNTCCGHPRPGESVLDAARRRLDAELGIEVHDLSIASSFIYRADLGNGLVEHELDHVVVGEWSGRPNPNPTEVSAWQWASPAMLRSELATHPDRYTAWLPLVLQELSKTRVSGPPAR